MERIDDLQLKGLRIIQDTELFCFGTDAVLLADFVRVPAGARVVDLGTGTGILPLLLYGRQPDASYTGLEIQPELCTLAQRSIALNELEQSIHAVCEDIREAPAILGGNYDIVVANPPYEKADDGAERENKSHGIARKEKRIDLDGLCESAAKLLRYKGRFYLIHKTARLAEVIAALKQHGLEPKQMRLVHANITREPKYVLLCAVKGANPELRVMPPLVLYRESGEKTPEHERIYNGRLSEIPQSPGPAGLSSLAKSQKPQ